MATGSWAIFHQYWPRLRPPLRPNAEVVAAVSGAIREQREQVLLLGVTPELSDIGVHTTAIDHSQNMLRDVWPGDTPSRRAVLGSWLELPFERQFTAAIGDGSLDVLTSAQHPLLFRELERVLQPGARIAFRIYATPERCESLAELGAQTLAGEVQGFHALKWRIAMAIAAAQGNMDVPVDQIYRGFQREFPDRERLGRATGWSAEDMAEIDNYAGLDSVYSFPTRREIVAALPRTFVDPRFVSSGSYPLAERCPVLIADYKPS
jgi:SAM-dependent methyltransferase